MSWSMNQVATATTGLPASDPDATPAPGFLPKTLSDASIDTLSPKKSGSSAKAVTPASLQLPSGATLAAPADPQPALIKPELIELLKAGVREAQDKFNSSAYQSDEWRIAKGTLANREANLTTALQVQKYQSLCALIQTRETLRTRLSRDEAGARQKAQAQQVPSMASWVGYGCAAAATSLVTVSLPLVLHWLSIDIRLAAFLVIPLLATLFFIGASAVARRGVLAALAARESYETQADECRAARLRDEQDFPAVAAWRKECDAHAPVAQRFDVKQLQKWANQIEQSRKHQAAKKNSTSPGVLSHWWV